ncbi:MAG: hypothetical protein DWQ37_00845 [Planctomycetota bacterium]|nr:MAG: hypothetical protein DWQ37_00845 [Planctomycetota bacterium]
MPVFLGYIGPGAGLGLIGALVGLFLAVLRALGFVVFWPVRRLLRKSKMQADGGGENLAD